MSPAAGSVAAAGTVSAIYGFLLRHLDQYVLRIDLSAGLVRQLEDEREDADVRRLVDVECHCRRICGGRIVEYIGDRRSQLTVGECNPGRSADDFPLDITQCTSERAERSRVGLVDDDRRDRERVDD